MASLELADLDDHTLVEALAAWERVASWAQAGSARALAELLERTRDTSGHEFVTDGVAARLGLTRRAAEQHVTVAHGTARLPEVADALAGGLVDRRKAEVLISTGRLPDDRRRQAVRDLLPDVEHLTSPQIRARLKRAEIEVDPDGAEERHQAARRDRYVRLQPVDDAMAYLTAYLPADDAVRAFGALDEAAFAMRRSPGEQRRLDECRADALTGLLSGILSAGPPAKPYSPDGSCTDPAGPDDGPGNAPDGGAVHARRADPVTREKGEGRRSVARPLVAEGSVIGSGTAGATPSRRGANHRAGVHVSVAASTLLGADDLPATLARYGPIPAGMARALASDPDAVWQRIFTDPGTGALVDTSARTYRPSPSLRAAVIARDITCTFPGCRVPATGCDLDHIAPYDPTTDGPQTHGDNLHALCRTHHRAKTTGGWHVTRDPKTGITHWTTPTGHQHQRPPEAHGPPEERGHLEADRQRPGSRGTPTGNGRGTPTGDGRGTPTGDGRVPRVTDDAAPRRAGDGAPHRNDASPTRDELARDDASTPTWPDDQSPPPF
ncbi:hypothetical protein GCM10009809_15870 [Isoptericola hypogeus]|uniref:HNH nuclease domain-containing protein n=1 Tax=Isoptericola hypogeus TaxID=300179 RepID=A0ABP4VB34_9MICO